MTPVQIFDVLHGKSFTYFETKDGGKCGGKRLTVNYCSDEGVEPACIEVTSDGLLLHFNSKGDSGMRGESVWFADIVSVG